MFDPNSPKSILQYAKKIKGKTLRKVCSESVLEHEYGGKGNFGQILEKYYFGYDPNSNSEPDFKEAGIELKSSPLKVLKNGEIRAKERMVLNIINYLKVYNEEFESSSFWKKNAHLLLVFYLHDKNQDLLDFVIKLVDDWKYPEEDLIVIKHDWEVINKKIRDGNAHELSEGDTFYLGACTKGSTAEKSLRNQPFNNVKAKQRAYSLKGGYVNHIIANIANEEAGVYGKILSKPEVVLKSKTLDEIVVSKFELYYGKSVSQITKNLEIDLNPNSKSYFANITNAILGLKLGQRIEEFEKAEIQVKTVRLKDNYMPKENISFPTFKYEELITTEWDDSDFKRILSSKFFFVFYQIKGDDLVLRQVKFWNISNDDLDEAKLVWDEMNRVVSKGKIVREVTKTGIRKTYFPKKSENRISHVRPHAKNAADTYPLPVRDSLTGLAEFTKHCFWLNDSFIRDEIYLK